MKKLPIGQQTFSKLIEQDLLYVDKTNFIWDLVNGAEYYFLSRPRRFGKSLLISTLKSYFQGEKALFSNLFIDKKEKNWTKHPIIHIDYSRIDYRTSIEIFRESTLSYLRFIANEYGLTIEETILPNYFQSLVVQLNQKYGKVVILVDEYDKPLVDTLDNDKRFAENRAVLNDLYGNFKSLDGYLRFVFLTGVSRFAKVGVFSGLNNLQDLSLDPSYSKIVGFTQEELISYFPNWLNELNKEYPISREDLLEGIKDWYNGFSWDGQIRLYNPFSIFNLFIQKIFSNYWFSTGTPSFLINAFVTQKLLPQKIEGAIVNDLAGSSIINKELALYPLLFQTGYLTIKKVHRKGFETFYELGFPNREVRHSFYTYLLSAFLKKDNIAVQPEAIRLKQALEDQDDNRFIELLISLFANIPARLHLDKEAFYQALLFLILRLVGVEILLEKETDKGRIDGVIELENLVYIIEIKFATNKRVKHVQTLVKQALLQIKDRKYYEAYLGKDKKIILFGIGFLGKQIAGRMEVLA